MRVYGSLWHIISVNPTTPKPRVTEIPRFAVQFDRMVIVFHFFPIPELTAITKSERMWRFGRNCVRNSYFTNQSNLKGAAWSRYPVALIATAVALNKNLAMPPSSVSMAVSMISRARLLNRYCERYFLTGEFRVKTVNSLQCVTDGVLILFFIESNTFNDLYLYIYRTWCKFPGVFSEKWSEKIGTQIVLNLQTRVGIMWSGFPPHVLLLIRTLVPAIG